MKLKEFVEVFDNKNEEVSIAEWQGDKGVELYEGRMYSIPEKLLNWEIDYVFQSYHIERKEEILFIFIDDKSQDIDSLNGKTDNYESERTMNEKELLKRIEKLEKDVKFLAKANHILTDFIYQENYGDCLSPYWPGDMITNLWYGLNTWDYPLPEDRGDEYLVDEFRENKPAEMELD